MIVVASVQKVWSSLNLSFKVESTWLSWYFSSTQIKNPTLNNWIIALAILGHITITCVMGKTHVLAILPVENST